MRARNLAAIAAIVLGLALSGCGAVKSPISESTHSPVSFYEREPGTTFEDPKLVEVPTEAPVEIPLDESGAPEEPAPAPQPAPAPEPAPAPKPAPAPAPQPAPEPQPVRCPAGSSATASDGFNDTSCMRDLADNGGSCWEGDNGMLQECQPFRP